MSKEWEFAEDAPSPEEVPRDRDLSEYWRMIVRHWRLIGLCVAVGVGIAAAVSLLSKPIYRAAAVLNVEKERASPLDPAADRSGGFDPEFLPTQMHLMTSREVAQLAAKRLRQADPSGRSTGGLSEGAIAWSIQRDAEAEPVKGTTLIELSYHSTSPRRAADVVNALAQAYVDWNLDARFRYIGQTQEFLNQQIAQLRSEVDAKEQQLVAYGRQKDIVSSDPRSNSAIQNLDSLNTDYAAAVAERIAREARYHELQRGSSDTIAEGLSGGILSTLKAEQAKLEREYSEKLNIYKPEWPAMQQLKSQIEHGRQHIGAVTQENLTRARDSARADYDAALRRETTLKGVLKSQRSEAMNLSSNSIEYKNLQAELDSKKALLDSLLKKKAETDVLSRLRGERVSSIRIVDAAEVPTSRFKPSYRKNGLLGLLGGAFFGIGLALFLGYLDRSIRTAEQVQTGLRLPPLGIVPAVEPHARGYGYGPGAAKKKPAEDAPTIELLPHSRPRSAIAERYRAFRTALLLSRAGGVRSIVVTSTLPREGKTATAVNLAVVLGQLGKRVLLVDADLHKPRLHEILRASNRSGLVSILAENMSPEKPIVRTELPGVFLLPSGPSSPNPSGLLSSEAMTNFLELARMNYDYVVLDAPPLGPVADAVVLGHQTDGVVLCVEGGKTPRERVLEVRDRLLRANVRILGVLINRLVEDSGRYAKGYGYEDGYYAAPMRDGEEAPTVSAARLI